MAEAKKTSRSKGVKKTAAPERIVSPPEPHDDLREFGGSYVRQSKSRGSNVQFVKGLVFVVVVAAIAVAAGYYVEKANFFEKVDSGDTYHAVFLNSGQVYFGTIEEEDKYTITMDNVFYMQVVNQELPPLEEGGEPQIVPTQQLVKKGEEFYGPESSIRINREQVSVIEELRRDSDVLRDIRANVVSK